MNRELIMLKYGEMALKGLNRTTFESRLMKNLRRAASRCGNFRFKTAQSTIYVEPVDETCDMEAAEQAFLKVFGLASVCRAAMCAKNMPEILETAENYLSARLKQVETFKVEARRSDKKYPMTSPEICAQVGGYLLERISGLKVDVHHPEATVRVEIRDFGAYVYADALEGAGGMPVGTAGRGALLLSGGIDSPVAGYMMAKRGVELCGVHFASPPYTSERAKLKVLALAKKVAAYSGWIPVYVVQLTEIQEMIRDHCPEDLLTVIMRRYMMKIAERLALKQGCLGLITGESLGQVASQTMEAIACTNPASSLPVYRPLIGMDKEEIIRISRKIDTFETSILPYEDCCTVFTPKHPKIRPKLQEILESEALLEEEALIERAVASAEKIVVKPESTII